MLLAELLEEAADACHADPAAVFTGRRFRSAVRARRAAIYAMRHYAAGPPSFSMLGHLLGTDHSTVMHNYSEALSQREQDPVFRQLTDILTEHARRQVANGKVGRYRTSALSLGHRAKPVIRRKSALGEREKQATYVLLRASAELFDAHLDEIFRQTHWNAECFNAAAAAIWAVRHGSDPRLSFPQLSYLFARHHSTVMHAHTRAAAMREECPEFARATDFLLTEAKRRLS